VAEVAYNMNQDFVVRDRRRARGREDLANTPLPGYDEVDSTLEHRTEDEAILEQMHHRLYSARDWWRENHQAAYEDVRFAYGEQWPEDAKRDRAGRPCLQFNILPQYLHQIEGQVRQSRFNFHVMQSSGSNDKVPVWVAGQATMYPVAEVMEGLMRDIEHRSRAPHAYARAVQHAAEGGFGWLFVKTVRPQDNPFEMEIRVQHIKDRWSVLMDPFCEMDDFSDASWGAISQAVPLRDFQARYPETPADSFGIGSGFDAQYNRWWTGPGEVRLCHYFYKKPMKRTVWKLISRDGVEIVEYRDRIEDILDELAAGGYRKVDEVEVDGYQVKHHLCVGSRILEGPNDWPGLRIPLVPVIGREINVDGYNHYAGLVRWAWDPQRMFNYFTSSAIERVALAPKSPWLGTADQLGAHAALWRDQLKRPDGVLLYDHQDGVDPPQRQDPATMPTAEMQIVLHMRQAIMETLGMYEASLGRKSNETSGVAIQRRQHTSQANTFAFIDNLAYAIASVGEILCDIIPRVYSADATRRIIMPDDSQASVQLNHEIVDDETGKTFRIANLGLSRYTCAVRAGPAFSTVREEFVSMITELSRTNPQIMLGTLDLVINNLDIPNARELSRRFKMMMPRRLLRPEDQANLPEEQEEQPTPEQQAEIAKSQAAIEEAKAKVAIAESQRDGQQLGLQQEQERTRQQELKTQEAQARLETVTEKGAIDLDKAATESKAAAGQEMGDDKKLRAFVKREVARALSETRQAA